MATTSTTAAQGIDTSEIRADINFHATSHLTLVPEAVEGNEEYYDFNTTPDKILGGVKPGYYSHSNHSKSATVLNYHKDPRFVDWLVENDCAATLAAMYIAERYTLISAKIAKDLASGIADELDLVSIGYEVDYKKYFKKDTVRLPAVLSRRRLSVLTLYSLFRVFSLAARDGIVCSW